MFRQLIGQAKIWKNKKLKLLGEEIDEYAALMNMLLPQLEKLEKNFTFHYIIKYHVYKLEESSDDSVHRIRVWLLSVNLVVHSRGVNNNISYLHEFSLIFFKITLVLLKFDKQG